MKSEVNGSSIKTPSLFAATVNAMYPASEKKNSHRICQNISLLNGDGASQILFCLSPLHFFFPVMFDIKLRTIDSSIVQQLDHPTAR